MGKIAGALSLLLLLIGVMIILATPYPVIVGSVVGVGTITNFGFLYGLFLILASSVLFAFANEENEEKNAQYEALEERLSSEDSKDPKFKSRKSLREHNRFAKLCAIEAYMDVYKKKPSEKELKEFLRPYHEKKEELAWLIEKYGARIRKRKEEYKDEE